MNTFNLLLLASAFSLAACQRDDAAADTTLNDEMVGAENLAVDSGTASMSNSAVATVDSAFVTEAMKGDNGEVAIGNLAAEKAASQAAKDFGKMLATDHGSHKQKLADLASTSGIPATEEPTEEGKASLEKLQGLSGAAFDKEFARMMVEDHTKDIAKYEKQAASGDAQTAALAKDTLPTLRKHLETARGLQK